MPHPEAVKQWSERPIVVVVIVVVVMIVIVIVVVVKGPKNRKENGTRGKGGQ